MKYLTILLVLSLAMCAMANDFDEIRELQAIAGKAAAKGSVKAKVAAPKAKLKIKVPAKPKIKVKPKISGGHGIGIPPKPKLKLKIHATKHTTPKKPKAKVNVKVKADAKKAVKTQAKALEGTCPYASKFGMKQVTAYANKGDVCKSLKSTCCDASSMRTFATEFKTWRRNLSKTMWTLMRIPAMAGNVMGNLKLDKCADADKKAKQQPM
jgi:hypothetical protein